MNSYPIKTHELRIELTSNVLSRCQQVKQALLDFMLDHGVDSYVEGSIDNVDIDNEPGGPERDFYAELGGVRTPLSVYKYDLESLQLLAVQIDKSFGAEVKLSFHSIDTQEWMEGWKQSFRPFATRRFYVYPPWESVSAAQQGLIPLVIEPGMAFGTGQHATTKLCLEGIEQLAQSRPQLVQGSMLDVGTGTAILAIAAYKLGWRMIDATDIDADAILASQRNLQDNHVKIRSLMKASVPTDQTYTLVIANILPMVLRVIMQDLCSAVEPGGLLMMSGLLLEQRAEITGLATGFGLKLIEQGEREGWARVLLEKPR